MTKLFVVAMLAGAAAIATPAAAATTGTSGTVNVTGSVASKCTAASPIGGTIALGELALTDGTVDSLFSAQPNKTLSFTIRCTAANVEIGLEATPLTIAGDATTDNGHTGTVHFKSTLVADKASSGTATAVYTTADTAPAKSTATLGDRMKNATNNLRVTVSDGATTTTGALLKAGDYAGTIVISVDPTV